MFCECPDFSMGTGLCKCELKYLSSHEMIVTLEDLLRRRSKIGLLTRAED